MLNDQFHQGVVTTALTKILSSRPGSSLSAVKVNELYVASLAGKVEQEDISASVQHGYAEPTKDGPNRASPADACLRL